MEQTWIKGCRKEERLSGVVKNFICAGEGPGKTKYSRHVISGIQYCTISYNIGEKILVMLF